MPKRLALCAAVVLAICALLLSFPAPARAMDSTWAVFYGCRPTTLPGAINSGATVVVAADPTAFGSCPFEAAIWTYPAGYYLDPSLEIVTVTAKSHNTLTVTRGVNSVYAAHPAGAYIMQVPTPYDTDEIVAFICSPRLPAGGTVGQALVKTGAGNGLAHWADGGTGNVTGPASAVAGNFPSLDATGKILSDNGYSHSSFDVAGAAAGVTVTTIGAVPTSRTVAGHALTGNVTVSAADVGLGSVTNDAQIKASIGTAKGDLVTFSASATPVHFAAGASAGNLRTDGSGNWAIDTTTFLSSVTAHNLLSATHGDTLADTVVRGDVLIGNVTPKWARLPFPATPTGKVLQATATDVAWSTSALGTAAYTASTAYDAAGSAGAITLAGLGAGTAATHATGDFLAAAAQAADSAKLGGSLPAAYALVGQTHYVGTTAIAINRTTGALALTGITSIDGSAASCTGLAASATILATARAINGTNFDGSAAITVPVANTNDATTNADVYPLWTATQGGNYAALTSLGLKYHPSTGLFTAAGFSGPLAGNVTGNVSGSAGSCTGAAASVTGLTITPGATISGANTGDQTISQATSTDLTTGSSPAFTGLTIQNAGASSGLSIINDNGATANRYPGFRLYSYAEAGLSSAYPLVYFGRANGTAVTPTVTGASYNVGQLIWQAHDGSVWQNVANVSFKTGADFDASHLDGLLQFSGRTGTGTLVASVSIFGAGSVVIGTATPTDGMTAGGSLAVAKDLAHRGTKAGFYNTAPASQPSAATDLGTALSDLGLRAAGTAYPITTSGAVAFSGTFGTGAVTAAGIVSSTLGAVTVGTGATTFAVTRNVMKVTGDSAGNTVATITGGVSGQLLTLIFVDSHVTITDTSATTANTANLSAAFTSAANTVLTLVYDGNKWFEVSRSVN